MLALHGKSILHRDVKPDNFLMHEGALQLNDFDISCFEHEHTEKERQPVGTPAYWSPRFDVPGSYWVYDQDDDWMGLALTFAFWLGFYSVLQQPFDIVAAKIGAVRALVASRRVPEALKARIGPVLERVTNHLPME